MSRLDEGSGGGNGFGVDATHRATLPDHWPSDLHEISSMLAAPLRAACADQLGDVEWFQASWQHSGALTGVATWRQSGDAHAGGAACAGVVIKLPVSPEEFEWTCALGSGTAGADCPTARVVASGESLAGHEVRWLVLERLTTPPLSMQDESAVRTLMELALEFHTRAGAARPLGARTATQDWELELGRARDVVKSSGIAHAQHWNDIIKRVQRHAHALQRKWDARAVQTWCHGDLHAGNVLRRAPLARDTLAPATEGAPGRWVLIDLALVHPGHWLEDAVYVERLHWGRPELLHGMKPVSTLARLRRERGLPVEDNYAELTDIRRVFMAATAPLFLEHEGHPKYVRAAMEMLEQALPRVAH